MDSGDAGDPGRASGQAPAPAGRRTRADSRPPEQVPTLAAPVFAAGKPDATGDTARRDAVADADPAKMPRSRRRVGFRKGADIDEEMWPTESFGGVTDDQFWDDLASDKPLTTTARSAQHDSGSQKRPLPPPGARVGQRPVPSRGATRVGGARPHSLVPTRSQGADRTRFRPGQAATRRSRAGPAQTRRQLRPGQLRPGQLRRATFPPPGGLTSAPVLRPAHRAGGATRAVPASALMRTR